MEQGLKKKDPTRRDIGSQATARCKKGSKDRGSVTVRKHGGQKYCNAGMPATSIFAIVILFSNLRTEYMEWICVSCRVNAALTNTHTYVAAMQCWMLRTF